MSVDDGSSPRTLYVGNLDPSVSEELLLALFGQLGPVKGCKIIHETRETKSRFIALKEPGNDPYAFIEFVEHQSAAAALLAMNKRLCLGKEMKVNWATTSGHQGKVDTSKHFHIFVGDLAPEIETQQLREAFAPFGDISDVKIMRFPDTHKPKGYGFISFVNKSDAETAIASMNGQWLGTRKIRTNWATRKVQPGQDAFKYKDNHLDGSEYVRKLDYNDVWSWTSDTNTSVYCGGIMDSSSSNLEELLRSIFSQYGTINEIRVFKEKGYGFIKFSTKEAACSAIVGVHGMEVGGYIAKCGWGRDDANQYQNSQALTGLNGQMTPNQGNNWSQWWNNWSPMWNTQPQQQYGPQGYGQTGQPGTAPPAGQWSQSGSIPPYASTAPSTYPSAPVPMGYPPVGQSQSHYFPGQQPSQATWGNPGMPQS